MRHAGSRENGSSGRERVYFFSHSKKVQTLVFQGSGDMQ